MIIEEYKKFLKIKDLYWDRARDAKAFIKYCDKRGIDYCNLTYQQIQDYFYHVKTTTHSNSTFNAALTELKLFVRFLIESGRTSEKVLEEIRKIKQLKIERKVKSFLTKEELSEAVQMGETYIMNMDPVKLRALLYFMFYTGLRKGELLNLRRADIDLDKCTVVVKTPTKNRCERVVFLPKNVISCKSRKSFNMSQLLQEYFDSEGETNNAFNMTTAKFACLFRNLKSFSPEKKLHPHLMRHSFARMLAKSGIDSRVAQKLLGHKDISTTMIYYDPDIDVMQDIYNEKVK